MGDLGSIYHWLASWLSPQSPWFLFLYGFLSATLLPGASEVAVYLSIQAAHISPLTILIYSSVGNTLGGMTNYLLGRCFPQRFSPSPQMQKRLSRYGYVALFFTWLPLFGDALCLAAGWLKMHWFPVLITMLIGKTLRYLVVIYTAKVIFLA